MLTADIIKTALEILFAAALLAGVWHRERLIALENAIEDKAAENVRGHK